MWAMSRYMGSLLLLASIAQLVSTAPVVEESTALDFQDSSLGQGCYYNFEHYEEGDRILTNEPCLNCTCHNRMLMCYLRVCPFTKAIGQDCVVEKKPDQCCPVITCPQVPVALLTSTTEKIPQTTTALGTPDNYGCTLDDNKFYADGAQVPSDPRKPCELCYCIRNRTACVMQECTLNVEGCRPVYQTGVCCPVRYDCDYDKVVTTPRPTMGLITTPGATSDCLVKGVTYHDGEMIFNMTTNPCEHYYCMRGKVVCAVQECGTPLQDADCQAMPTEPGQCCPSTYTCANGTVPAQHEAKPTGDSVEPITHLDESHVHQDSSEESGSEESEEDGEKAQPGSDESEREESNENQENKPDEGLAESPVTTVQPESIPSSDSSSDMQEPVKADEFEPIKTSEMETTEHSDSATSAPVQPSSHSPAEVSPAEPKPEATESAEATTSVQYTEVLAENVEMHTSHPDIEVQEVTTQSQVADSEVQPSNPVQQILQVEQPAKPHDESVVNEIPEVTPTVEVAKPTFDETEPVEAARVPGEGSCLFQGRTYAPNTEVPTTDVCQSSCRCVNSIIECQTIECPQPPLNLYTNCKEVKSTSSCCPTYECDQKPSDAPVVENQLGTDKIDEESHEESEEQHENLHTTSFAEESTAPPVVTTIPEHSVTEKPESQPEPSSDEVESPSSESDSVDLDPMSVHSNTALHGGSPTLNEHFEPVAEGSDPMKPSNPQGSEVEQQPSETTEGSEVEHQPNETEKDHTEQHTNQELSTMEPHLSSEAYEATTLPPVPAKGDSEDTHIENVSQHFQDRIQDNVSVEPEHVEIAHDHEVPLEPEEVVTEHEEVVTENVGVAQEHAPEHPEEVHLEHEEEGSEHEEIASEHAAATTEKQPEEQDLEIEASGDGIEEHEVGHTSPVLVINENEQNLDETEDSHVGTTNLPELSYSQSTEEPNVIGESQPNSYTEVQETTESSEQTLEQTAPSNTADHGSSDDSITSETNTNTDGSLTSESNTNTDENETKPQTHFQNPVGAADYETNQHYPQPPPAETAEHESDKHESSNDETAQDVVSTIVNHIAEQLAEVHNSEHQDVGTLFESIPGFGLPGSSLGGNEEANIPNIYGPMGINTDHMDDTKITTEAPEQSTENSAIVGLTDSPQEIPHSPEISSENEDHSATSEVEGTTPVESISEESAPNHEEDVPIESVSNDEIIDKIDQITSSEEVSNEDSGIVHVTGEKHDDEENQGVTGANEETTTMETNPSDAMSVEDVHTPSVDIGTSEEHVNTPEGATLEIGDKTQENLESGVQQVPHDVSESPNLDNSETPEHSDTIGHLPPPYVTHGDLPTPHETDAAPVTTSAEMEEKPKPEQTADPVVEHSLHPIPQHTPAEQNVFESDYVPKPSTNEPVEQDVVTHVTESHQQAPEAENQILESTVKPPESEQDENIAHEVEAPEIGEPHESSPTDSLPSIPSELPPSADNNEKPAEHVELPSTEHESAEIPPSTVASISDETEMNAGNEAPHDALPESDLTHEVQPDEPIVDDIQSTSVPPFHEIQTEVSESPQISESSHPDPSSMEDQVSHHSEEIHPTHEDPQLELDHSQQKPELENHQVTSHEQDATTISASSEVMESSTESNAEITGTSESSNTGPIIPEEPHEDSAPALNENVEVPSSTLAPTSIEHLETEAPVVKPPDSEQFQNWAQKPFEPPTTSEAPRPPEDSHYPYEQDYEDDDAVSYGPGTCRYGGKVYLSAQQIPRDDPCDFCFCFRSDIICLQQSCPPPIKGCYQETIKGFCCPRYECHVSMATVMNATTTTTTTTTTLPPLFFAHNYQGAVTRSGCQVKGIAYRVGDRIPTTSGPCLDCRCGANGQMQCNPTVCSPQETLLRQVMDAASVNLKRR